MIGLIQRVAEASVSVNGTEKAAINKGLLVFLGIEEADEQQDVDWLANKVVKLRIFDDDEGVMNRSVLDEAGEIMVISQFTLHARTKKGSRPSYIDAAHPDQSIPLYNAFVEKLEQLTGKAVKSGEFGANMQVGLVNDGPVTIPIDTKNKR